MAQLTNLSLEAPFVLRMQSSMNESISSDLIAFGSAANVEL